MLWLALYFQVVLSGGALEVAVDISDRLNTVSPFYRGYNIDLSRNREFFDIDFTEQRLDYLAQSLGPAFLRVGGTGNDYVEYEFGGVICDASRVHRIAPKLGKETEATAEWNCVNQTQWDGFNAFAQRSGAMMIFGLNIMQRGNFSEGNPMGNWDPSNTRALLEYSLKKGYKFWGFELGNEQGNRLTPQRAADDFLALRLLVDEFWPEPSTRPRLLGPDPTSLGNTGMVGPELDAHDAPILTYVTNFAREARVRNVGLHAITVHEYIESNVSTANQAWKLNVSAYVAQALVRAVQDGDPDVEPWFGEIGPHNGGSPPCSHDYERWSNWANSLWYADALGAKAANGVKAFCRQDFVGADYGLVDCQDHTPTPDYFTALLWGQLMGQGVLSATTSAAGDDVRVYAHCGAAGDGGVALLAVNIGSRTATASVTGLAGPRTEYILTGSEGLGGLTASLNGLKLTLTEKGELPVLVGKDVAEGVELELPPESVAFLAFPAASAPACTEAAEPTVVV